MNNLNEAKTAYINLPSEFEAINEILSNNEDSDYLEIKGLLLSNCHLSNNEAEYWAAQHRVFRMNIVKNDGTIYTPTGRVLGL